MVTLMNYEDGTLVGNFFQKTLADITSSDMFILRNVKENYKYDTANKCYTDILESIIYSVFVEELYGVLNIKITGMQAIISPDKLKAADGEIYVRIPLEQTIIRPYALATHRINNFDVPYPNHFKYVCTSPSITLVTD